MEIKRLLEEEIEDELNELSGLDLGSDTYKASVDGITKLLDRAIEMEKAEKERDEKVKDREIETQYRDAQALAENKDRWIRNGIAIAGIVVPSVITVWGTIKSINFEKDGTITTIMGRGFISKLLPKK